MNLREVVEKFQRNPNDPVPLDGDQVRLLIAARAMIEYRVEDIAGTLASYADLDPRPGLEEHWALLRWHLGQGDIIHAAMGIGDDLGREPMEVGSVHFPVAYLAQDDSIWEPVERAKYEVMAAKRQQEQDEAHRKWEAEQRRRMEAEYDRLGALLGRGK